MSETLIERLHILEEELRDRDNFISWCVYFENIPDVAARAGYEAEKAIMLPLVEMTKEELSPEDEKHALTLMQQLRQLYE